MYEVGSQVTVTVDGKKIRIRVDHVSRDRTEVEGTAVESKNGFAKGQSVTAPIEQAKHASNPKNQVRKRFRAFP